MMPPTRQNSRPELSPFPMYTTKTSHCQKLLRHGKAPCCCSVRSWRVRTRMKRRNLGTGNPCETLPLCIKGGLKHTNKYISARVCETEPLCIKGGLKHTNRYISARGYNTVLLCIKGGLKHANKYISARVYNTVLLCIKGGLKHANPYILYVSIHAIKPNMFK